MKVEDSIAAGATANVSTDEAGHVPGRRETLARTVGHYRWTICALLFFGTTMNYVDRQVLGLLAPELQSKIGWNEVQYGYIVTAFQAAYALACCSWGG